MYASDCVATNFSSSSYHALNAILRMTAAVAVLLCLATFCSPRALSLPGGDAPGQLVFGGLPRTYQVHVPAGIDHPAGLVINLHGAGQTGGEQAAVTNYNAVADQHGFVAVYPDGIDFSWADGGFLASGGADAADLLGGMSVHHEMKLSQRLIGLGGGVVGIGVGLWGATRRNPRAGEIPAS
jgi:polyhydroxybutyrate depolymerase